MLKKEKLKLGKKYEFKDSNIQCTGKIIRITKDSIYFEFGKDEDVRLLKIKIPFFLEFAKSLSREPSGNAKKVTEAKKLIEVCAACGSSDLETVYDHDCWGKSDGSRTFCNVCRCNTTKYI